MTETPAAAWVDPYRSHNFQVQIDRTPQAGFHECSSIGVSVDYTEVRQGGREEVVHKVPGIVRYDDVTLKFGLTSSTVLFDWMMAVARGEIVRRLVTIVLMDAQGTSEVLFWNLSQAMPVRLRSPRLTAATSGLAIEEITFTYESLTRSGAGTGA